jgi:opacity protein-like surface antigen
MSRFKLHALIGAALLVVPLGALAADYPQPPPYVPPPAGFHGDWYLKGYIGGAFQHFGGLEHPLFLEPDTFQWLHRGEFDGVPLAGIGIGFRHSDHLRFDITGEYRGKSGFSALDRYDSNTENSDFDDDCTFAPGEDCGTNHYTGQKQEWLVLANAYFDLNEIHGIRPYIGAGIGASYNTIYNFIDNNVITNGQAWAPTGSRWSLAWALHAGASLPVNDRLTLELGYSFVKLGDAVTGPFQNVDPNASNCLPNDCVGVVFKDIYSHDFKIAARWALGHTQPSYPVMAKY